MAASKTAEYMALYRALEDSETRRKPLFSDPFASAFLSRDLRLALRAARVRPLRTAIERYADWRAPGARSSAIGRTRFIDEAVVRRAKDGVTQVVVLGAGFDSRAHRLPDLVRTTVFEVDRPETQATKRARLARTGVNSRADVRYVAVDFGVDDIGERLLAAGWTPHRPTTFIWEGVTNYLTEASVTAVLDFVATSGSGSTLIFTYIHRGVLDGSATFEGADKLVRNVAHLGEPWTFGIDPREVGAFVSRHGLELEGDIGADEYRRRYFGNSRRELRGYGFYRIAVAQVRDS